MQAVVFFGMPVVELTMQCNPGASRIGAKTDASCQLGSGGFPVNGAVGFRLAAGADPAVVGAIGDDPLARLANQQLQASFPAATSVTAASATRISTIVRGIPGDADRIFTHRSVISNPAAAVAAVEKQLKNRRASHVAIGSLGDKDAEVLDRVIAAARQNRAGVWFVPTTSQISNRARLLQTLLTLEKQDFVAMNHHELRTLSGTAGIREGMLWVREAGVRASLLVTAAGAGMFLFDAESGNHHYQPAFKVEMNQTASDVGAGDHTVGCLLAYVAETKSRGDLPDWKHGLKLAAAAAALHISGQTRLGGWSEVRNYADTAPVHSFRPEVYENRRPLYRRPAVAAAAMAMVTSVLSLMFYAIS